MNYALVEDYRWRELLPLVWLRPAYELRCGRDRLIDKLRRHLAPHVHRICVREAMAELAAERLELAEPAADAPWCLLNTRLLVTHDVGPPALGTAWRRNGDWLAVTLPGERVDAFARAASAGESELRRALDGVEFVQAPDGVLAIEHPWDLVKANGPELRRQCMDGGVRAGRVDPGVHLLNEGGVHIVAGARVKPGVVLDAESGPIYIDADAEIQPNVTILGPCYIGPRTIVRPGAVLRGDVSIGPVCRVGGEIESTIFQGYSNKQHDGFVGHSFIGEWVNLGAATVTSDLKNTYGTIRVSVNGQPVETGQHFLGATIADHAKTGIGTILPTGGVIGVAANVFTQNPVPKFVPSFAWLTDAGLTQYRLEKAVRIARVVMGRRDRELGPAERRLLEHVAEAARQIEAAGWEVKS